MSEVLAPTEPPPAPREFVALRMRRNGIIGLVFFGVVFVGVLQSPLVPQAKGTNYIVLGVVGFLATVCGLAALSPPRFVLGADFALQMGPVRYHSPTSNVREITFDGTAVRVVFHDVAQLEPRASSAWTNTGILRKQAEERFRTHGAHFTLLGFQLAQVDELRTALGLPPPSPDEPAGRVESFYRTLLALTPRAWVTVTLLAVNVVVFAAMVVSGVHPLDPMPESLLEWGANFAPLSAGGQWWRLLTCAFLHIGVVHLLLNMWVLVNVGGLVERLLGNVPFLVLYLAAGLCGSAASLHWNPVVVSAGASGAIFGLFGALLGFLWRSEGAIPAEALRKLRRSGIAFVAYNLILGFLAPGIDNAAHVGGLAAGFVGGVILAGPLAPQPATRRVLRPLAVAALAFVVVSAAVLRPPRGLGGQVEYMRVLTDFEAAESRALGRYNELVQQLQENRVTEEQLAAIVEREVLPPWREVRRRLEAVPDLPEESRQHRALLLEYVKVREEAWEMLVRGIRTGDTALLQASAEAAARADRQVERMNKERPR